MIEKLTQCILTGYQLKAPISLSSANGAFIEYFHEAPGNVKVDLTTIQNFINQSKFNHPILAGICRNAFEIGEEPPLISNIFILIKLKNIPYPKEFKEKAKSFLNYLYKNGGRNFEYFEINSAKDYPICYSNNKEEFERVM